MAKKSKRIEERQIPETKATVKSRTVAEETGKPGRIGKLFSIGKRGWLIVGITAFVALGVLGAGLKYLEDDATRQMANRDLKTENPNEQTLLNSINPFLANPLPPPTPQLSKEYIYAGGKMLAVEDANANAAPPADLAVWRPDSSGTGTWLVMGGTGSQQTSVQWGANTDTTVPGDYDGDGKTDFSVFRSSTGYWYIQNSSNSVMTTYYFGASTDKVAPADYDGDGRTDAAVYRPSTGFWYIQKSSDGTVMQQQWGLGTDVYTITPADFDGDGKADIAVWYSTNMQFLIRKSSDAQIMTINVGLSGKPVPADYDGDGKADAAIWGAGPYQNQWHIVMSSGQTIAPISAGVQATDIAVQNDYDGDGKVDRAVWHPQTGTWYIFQSTKLGQPDEIRSVQWGQNGDIPVPAFYRR